MKKTVLVLLVLASAILMSACAGSGVVSTIKESIPTNIEKGNNYNVDMENVNNAIESNARIWPWEDPNIVLPEFTGEVTEPGTIKSLKVLAIGDSSSKDAMQFLAKLALEAGIEDVKIGMLYRNGGGALDGQSNDFKNNTAAYTYYEDIGEGWTIQTGARAQDVLLSEVWDYVIIHQNLCLHPDATTYSSLSNMTSAIHNLLFDNANENAKILWMHVWAYEINSRNNLFNHTKYYKDAAGNYDQMLMYNKAVEAIQSKVLVQGYIDGVIPVGTAIQNMRESYWSDGLTRDAEYLTNTGKVAAAVAMFKYLTGYDINDMKMSDPVFDHARPHLNVIKESANNAYLNPYEVTPSVYDMD